MLTIHSVSLEFSTADVFMSEKKKPSLKRGKYESADGKKVFVTDVALNEATGEQMVLFYIDNGAQRLRVLSREQFENKIYRIKIDGSPPRGKELSF